MARSASPFDPQQALAEAVALHRQGRFDEAERLYGRVLKAHRDHFDALHLLGMLNHQRGKAGEAHRLIAAALRVNPRSVDALSNMALVLHALKRDAEALASLDKALAIAPGHLDALNNRGSLLLELKRPDEALATFDALLKIDQQHVQAQVNRANALAELGRHEEALAGYDAILAQQPGNPHALYNRGNALRALGRHAEAIASYDRALATISALANAWNNRGLALQSLNRHQEAAASFQKALAVRPDDAGAHFNLASALLTLGDYRGGLPHYEWRLKRLDRNPAARFSKPVWLGEYPLAGKAILLHAEQGLGDTIQFARYAPVLARGGAKVVLEVQPELKPLLASLGGVSILIGRGEPLPAFDVHCPLASLPLACKTELATIPADIPYLQADDALVAQWRTRLDAVASPRIALVWSGQPNHPNDRNRSMAFTQLAPLLAVPGLHFVSVQRDMRPADAETLKAWPRIADVGGELATFADTAAVLSLCDLVVCVDTSVAHAAAALGRPTFILLPFQPDWRWLLGCEHSPWYPQARLFRQPAPGDWAGAIRLVCDAITARFDRAGNAGGLQLS